MNSTMLSSRLSALKRSVFLRLRKNAPAPDCLDLTERRFRIADAAKLHHVVAPIGFEHNRPDSEDPIDHTLLDSHFADMFPVDRLHLPSCECVNDQHPMRCRGIPHPVP